VTAIHGKSTGVLLGRYNLTEYLREIAPSRTTEPADASHFGTNDKEYVVGMSDATISYGGLYAGGTDQVADILEAAAAQDSAEPVTVCFGGIRVGSAVQFGRTRVSSFEATAPIADIVSISGATQCDGGLRSGICLSTLTPVTETTAGASHDNGSGTTRGGRAVMHLVANTHDGDVTVTIQHSTNGSVWVDLHQFVVVPGGDLAAEHVSVEGNINRYTRALVTLAGTSGEVVVVAALNRK
jgi:hypothetical protein